MTAILCLHHKLISMKLMLQAISIGIFSVQRYRGVQENDLDNIRQYRIEFS